MGLARTNGAFPGARKLEKVRRREAASAASMPWRYSTELSSKHSRDTLRTTYTAEQRMGLAPCRTCRAYGHLQGGTGAEEK